MKVPGGKVLYQFTILVKLPQEASEWKYGFWELFIRLIYDTIVSNYSHFS